MIQGTYSLTLSFSCLQVLVWSIEQSVTALVDEPKIDVQHPGRRGQRDKLDTMRSGTYNCSQPPQS